MFFRFDDDEWDVEVWVSDGTVEGTFLVKDVNPDTTSWPNELTDVDGTLFFTAENPEHGRLLWVSDGTEEGTHCVTDNSVYSLNDYPVKLYNFNGRLMFWMNDGIHGMELWSTNGDEDSTYMVTDLYEGPEGSIYDWTTVMAHIDDTLFFTARDSLHGNELWCMKPKITGIDQDIKQEGQLTVWPNPGNGDITVSFSSGEKAGIIITDIYGRQIFNKKNINSGEIKLHIERDGIYILRLTAVNRIYTKKVIVKGDK